MADLPISLCWHCDRALDAATGVGADEGALPEPGAVSLCLYCGAVGIFQTGLALRPPTEAELDEMGASRAFRRTYTQFSWARQYVMRRESLLRERADPDR